jgi:streptomycin 3"-adenylyltransferase
MKNIPLEVQDMLDLVKSGYREILRDNLVGIYVHGSLAMGGFNFKFSDIDYLVVVKNRLSTEAKEEIINLTINLSDRSPGKGIEMSIILKQEVEDFKYPTPFELYYSLDFKQDYIENKVDYSDTSHRDPDLSAHITVILSRGFCLYGEPIEKVFSPVPDKYYVQSLINDVERAKEDIVNDPVYNILNLSRTFLYLKEKKVLSKLEGGKMINLLLPKKYRYLVDSALDIYTGKTKKIEWNVTHLKEFVNDMLGMIYNEA